MQESGRYTIQAEIASGSTATVFLAEDAVLRRKVALKKLHPHLLNHAETVKRFGQEAVAVARISHENIIRVYDFGNQDRNLYLAMEYVDGSTLEGILARTGGPLPVRVCHALFHQLMLGLTAAHAQGIVHRDIKPSNLLVDREGRVRIADFGIAFLVEEKNITKTGAFLGTPVYSAPEQALCRPSSAKSDIFSSGILFYRCLTGRLPFDGESPHAILAAILEKSPGKPGLINPRILPGFSELTLAMLAKDPGQRPAAADCLRELETLAGLQGMPIERGRIRRFLDDGAAYAGEESRELSWHFLRLARAAQDEGRTREAVKLAALAELHGGVPEDARPEILRIEAAGKSRSRRRAVGAAMAGLLLVLAVTGIFRAGIRGKAASPSLPSSSTEAPALPVTVPLVPETDGILLKTAFPTPGSGHPPAAPSLPPEAGAESPVSAPASSHVAASPAGEPSRREDGTPASANPPRMNPAAKAASAAKQPPPAAETLAPGFLLVKTNPPFARVSLDGRELGITPFKAGVELPAGEHEILIEREGCLPATSRIRIEPGLTASVRIALERFGNEASVR